MTHNFKLYDLILLQTTMDEVKIDERGRINIGRKVSEKYGDHFFVVKLHDEIVLIPRPEDPLKELRKWGHNANLRKNTSKEIRKLAEEEFYKELDEKKKRK
jgi:hypothetical protein